MADQQTQNKPKPVPATKDAPRVTRDMVAGRRSGTYQTR